MMLNIAYYLSIGLLDLFRIFIIYKYILQFELKLNRRTIFFPLGLTVFLYFVLFYFQFYTAYGIVQIIIVYICAVTMIHCGRIRYLLAASFLIAIHESDQIVLSAFLIRAPHESVMLIYNSPFHHLFAAAVSTCILYGIGRVIDRKEQKSRQQIDGKYSILLTIIVSMNALVQFAMIRLLFHLDNQGASRDLLLSVSLLECISFGEVIILTIFSVTKETYKKSDELSQYQLKIKTAYYEEVLAKEQDTRKFRHDIKNLFLSIQLYNRAGDRDKVESCINELLQKPIFSATSYHCGDELVNAILSNKNAYAKHANASIQCLGHLPRHRISKTDLCVIFGNLSDNAIEACEKLNRDAQIKVTLHTFNQDLLIRIENPVEVSQTVHKGTLIDNPDTTKMDKEYHGFGIQNIRDCIEKYQGNLKITVENNIFTVMLTLRNVILP